MTDAETWIHNNSIKFAGTALSADRLCQLLRDTMAVATADLTAKLADAEAWRREAAARDTLLTEVKAKLAAARDDFRVSEERATALEAELTRYNTVIEEQRLREFTLLEKYKKLEAVYFI